MTPSLDTLAWIAAGAIVIGVVVMVVVRVYAFRIAHGVVRAAERGVAATIRPGLRATQRRDAARGRRVLDAELPGSDLPLRLDEVGIHPLLATSFAEAGAPNLQGSRWATAWHAEMLALLVEQGQQDVFEVDLLVVQAGGEGLGAGQRLAGFLGEAVHVHEVWAPMAG